MKRTAILRHTPLLPGKPLTRSQVHRLTRRAAKRRALHADPTWAAVRTLLWERCGGRCERCGVALHPRGWDGHHRKRRSQGGQHSTCNAVALCPTCHTGGPDAVHRQVRAAKVAGWVVHPTADPATVPIQLWDGRKVRLDHHGGYAAATEGAVA